MKNKKDPKITIILPCRNEEQALPLCLAQIKDAIKKNNLSAEIIVSDSSTDKSPEIAQKENVILIKHDKKGYGTAYLQAFPHAKGRYIFMADADCTYDFNEIPKFIAELESGYDFVIGNRFSGDLKNISMSFSHKYIGNPFLSFIMSVLFQTKIKDSQCGMRAIRKDVLKELNLKTPGMEFASEMIAKLYRYKLKIKELPISYYARKGISKMRSCRDATRHITFMIFYYFSKK